MTTLAFDGRYLAADQQATMSGSRCRTKKLFRMRDGSFVAAAGAEEDALRAIRYFDELTEGKEVDRPELENVAMIRVWPDGRVCHYETFLEPLILRDRRFTHGTGMDGAMAILLAGGNAMDAVAAAIQIDCKSGMGIDWIDTLTGEEGEIRYAIAPVQPEIAMGAALKARVADALLRTQRGGSPGPANNRRLVDVDAPGPRLKAYEDPQPSLRQVIEGYFHAQGTPMLAVEYIAHLSRGST